MKVCELYGRIILFLILITCVSWFYSPGGKAQIITYKSFEEEDVGMEPEGWDIEKVGDVTLEVTNEKASDGVKSLLINNSVAGSYIKSASLNLPTITSGDTVLVSFDLFFETTNRFFIGLCRKEILEYGPCLHINNNAIDVMHDGTITRGVVPLTPGKWYRITFKIYDQKSKKYQLKVEELLNGQVESVLYDEPTLWNYRNYKSLELGRFEFHDNSKAINSKTYIDNIKVVTNYEQTINNSSSYLEMSQDLNNDGNLELIGDKALANGQPVEVKVKLTNFEGNPIVNAPLSLISSRNVGETPIDLIQAVDRNLEDEYGAGITDETGVAYFTIASTQATMGTPVLLTVIGEGIDGELIQPLSFLWKNKKLIEQMTLTTNPLVPGSPGLRGETTFKFNLAQDSKLTLTIYDFQGRIVATLLADQFFPAGYHGYSWDGKVNGSVLRTGIYVYRLFARTSGGNNPDVGWVSGVLGIKN